MFKCMCEYIPVNVCVFMCTHKRTYDRIRCLLTLSIFRVVAALRNNLRLFIINERDKEQHLLLSLSLQWFSPSLSAVGKGGVGFKACQCLLVTKDTMSCNTKSLPITKNGIIIAQYNGIQVVVALRPQLVPPDWS